MSKGNEKRYRFSISLYRIRLIHLYTLFWLGLLLINPRKANEFTWEDELYITFSPELYPHQAGVERIDKPIVGILIENKMRYLDVKGRFTAKKWLVPEIEELLAIWSGRKNEILTFYIMKRVYLSTDPLFYALLRDLGRRTLHQKFYKRLFKKNMLMKEDAKALLKDMSLNENLSDLLRKTNEMNLSQIAEWMSTVFQGFLRR